MKPGHVWLEKNIFIGDRLVAMVIRHEDMWQLSMYVNSKKDSCFIPLAPASDPMPDLDYVYNLFLLRYEEEL